MKETLKLINQQYDQGKVVVATVEGVVSYDMEEFVKQHADGILYDLNRGEETTLALADKNDPRWINDYAVAKVIRRLKNPPKPKQIRITKELLISNGYTDNTYDEYYEYFKEVDGYCLTFKYDMSNTPNRDWYLHVDSSDRCTVAGCDVQYIHQAQQLMEIFDVKLEFEL